MHQVWKRSIEVSSKELNMSRYWNGEPSYFILFFSFNTIHDCDMKQRYYPTLPQEILFGMKMDETVLKLNKKTHESNILYENVVKISLAYRNKLFTCKLLNLLSIPVAEILSKIGRCTCWVILFMRFWTRNWWKFKTSFWTVTLWTKTKVFLEWNRCS